MWKQISCLLVQRLVLVFLLRPLFACAMGQRPRCSKPSFPLPHHSHTHHLCVSRIYFTHLLNSLLGIDTHRLVKRSLKFTILYPFRIGRFRPSALSVVEAEGQDINLVCLKPIRFKECRAVNSMTRGTCFPHPILPRNKSPDCLHCSGLGEGCLWKMYFCW